MNDDATLLRRYRAERDEDAFAKFVERHLPLVYSAALRRLNGDTHRAKDVAQVVFCTAAREAHRLARHPELTGWLYTATRNAALDIIRSEQRRRGREQEAEIMPITTSHVETEVDWSRLQPVLDAAMDELGNHDRTAVLLRFFQSRPFAEIGAALGLSEDAARKRVARALEKLRALLERRHLVSTSAALAALLSSETVSAAPPHLASTITGTALAVGSASAGAGAAGLALTKLHLALAALVITAGAAGLVVQQHTIAQLRAQKSTLAKPTDAAAPTATASRSSLRSSPSLATATLGTLEGQSLDTSSAPRSASTAAAFTGQISTQTPNVAAQPAPQASTSAPVHPSAGRDRTRMHKRYDPFLQRQGLTPEQIERFLDLKLAIGEAQADLQTAMRRAGAQGGSPDSEKLRQQLVGPLWQEIRELLGEEGYRAYGAYEAASAIHMAYTEPILPLFEASHVALSLEQIEGLGRIFQRNQRSVRANPSDIYLSNRMDWDGVLTEAAQLLSPPQLDILRTHAGSRLSVSR